MKKILLLGLFLLINAGVIELHAAETTTSQKVKGASLGLGCGAIMASGTYFLEKGLRGAAVSGSIESLPLALTLAFVGIGAIILPTEYIRRKLVNKIEVNTNQEFLQAWRPDWLDKTLTDKIRTGTAYGLVMSYLGYREYREQSGNSLF